MTARPLVSVILPTYNRETFLREAVDSVLAQTYDEWELLVIDDGSTDGTRAYLETLTDPRVRSLLRPHTGNLALLRNVGARVARGSYIAFLDSDDLWLPEKLALQMADLLVHPECGWSYTGRDCIDERGRDIPSLARRPPTHRGWILEGVIAARARFPTAAIVVEQRVWEATGGFDEALLRCEDCDLRIKLAEASPATVVPAALVKIRVHPENSRVNPLDELAYMNRIYGGLLRRSQSFRVRWLCRRQRARVDLDIVGGRRRAGQYADARRALRVSLPVAWWHPGWWIALAKTLLRPLIPGAVLSLYSRIRSRSRSPTTAPDGDHLAA